MEKDQVKRRILFVDDEPKVLQGLRRMLRNMRHQWTMDFAESGYKALELLKQNSFDVIVSDMRMPGMDGSELLTRVKQDYPMIVRIVLSGHSEKEMILKTVRPAHQYLSKPCDPKELLSTVSRSCNLRDLLSEQSLKQIVSRTESLPSMPSLYLEVMDELRSSDGSIQKVGKIIEKDISMSAKMLQLINSSFFGLPRHVSDPSQAVILLGLNTVRSLVLTIGLFSQFNNTAVSQLNVQTTYDHSIRAGTIAKTVAKMETDNSEQIDNAFMGGMLHDVGKLVFAANFPETYKEVIELSRREQITIHEAELEKFGAGHAEVGGYLLGLWGLSDTIVESVAMHHNPWECPVSGFSPLTAVYSADILEHRLHTEADDQDVTSDFNQNYSEQAGLLDRIPLWTDQVGQLEWET